MSANWITRNDNKWRIWQEYASQWLESSNDGLGNKIKALVQFFEKYLFIRADYASDPIQFFQGSTIHRCSADEFISIISETSAKTAITSSNTIANFIDWIISNYYMRDNNPNYDKQRFVNPMIRTKKTFFNQSETSKNVLPYKYICELRKIINPCTTKSGEKPYGNFSDWKKAHFIFDVNSTKMGKMQSWFKVTKEDIDFDDKDCVWRERNVKKNSSQTKTIYEMWNPVISVFLLLKLHLPIRTYQGRMLDSGEADTYRYEDGDWCENYRAIAKGTLVKPFKNGVFCRLQDNSTQSFSTGFFINTNKTADKNLDPKDRGYIIPWNHVELLYWLEKLRNWQEKYNLILKPTNCNILRLKDLGQIKSKEQLQYLGKICFLFRHKTSSKSNNSELPVNTSVIKASWYRLLYYYESYLFNSGVTYGNNKKIQFVFDYSESTPFSERTLTYFSLHSLRVSIITHYAIDTNIPLPVISKLIAGHASMIMTLHYVKLTPGVMHEKMREAHDILQEKQDDSLKLFIYEKEIGEILAETSYIDAESVKYKLTEDKNYVAWEQKFCGVCLAGGNTAKISGLDGCWNGGLPEDPGQSGYLSPGVQNCVRCRWLVTDASYLPALVAKFNSLSERLKQSSSCANKNRADLDALLDEQYKCQENNIIFNKNAETHELQHRYETQRSETDTILRNQISLLNLITKAYNVETNRTENNNAVRMVTSNHKHSLKPQLEIFETNSHLFLSSIVCRDAEIFPSIKDDLLKTNVIGNFSQQIDRVLSANFKPVLMFMDDDMKLAALNAFQRKIALSFNKIKEIEGYECAANYIEAKEYLQDSKLLTQAFEEIASIPLTFSNQPKITSNT